MIRDSVYRSWSDDELVRAITVDREDYLPEAAAKIASEISRRSISHETLARTEHEVRKDNQDQVLRLSGVRGWLFVFVSMVGLNTLGALAEGLSGLVRSPGDPILALIYLPSLMLGIYGLYVNALLIGRKAGAPRHASWWLIAGFATTLFHAAIIYFLRKEFVLNPLSGLAMLVWLTYLEHSKRVAATYGQVSSESGIS